MEEKTKKKWSKKKIIILSILAIFVIFVVIPALPFIGFVVVILWEAFINVPAKPEIKQAEFPFEIVYEYKGETHTISDILVIEYEGISFSIEGGNSLGWKKSYKNNNGEYFYYPEPGNEDIMIQPVVNENYFMGNPEYADAIPSAIIYYGDEATGTNYEETDLTDVIGLKIVSTKFAEPIKNKYK